MAPKVLIIYSNPSDSSRLRLDKECRAIDQVLSRLRLPSETCRRLHAASLEDVAQALRADEFDLVQISGHGSKEGVYLERQHLDAGVTVSADRVAALLRCTCPHLRASVFLSCFSAESLPALLTSAPRVITVSGPADDEAAVQFAAGFYDEFLSSSSVEEGFKNGLLWLDIKGLSDEISPVLSRRGADDGGERLLVEALINEDPVLVDLTPAMADIQTAGIDPDRLLSLVVRKIRVHRWIFKYPKDRAIVPIGQFIGIMSWKDARDLITCHRLLRVRESVSDAAFKLWANVVTSYNDRFASPYRLNNRAVEPQDERLLKRTIDEFFATGHYLFDEESRSSSLREIAPEQFKVTSGLFSSHLTLADDKFTKGDSRMAAVYLEAALSSLHDLVDALTEAIIDNSQDLRRDAKSRSLLSGEMASVSGVRRNS
jgi:hypothetical protein